MSDQQQSDEVQHDGFNVEETVDYTTFVDYGYDEVDEYIHLIPDVKARELRCYRSIDEPGEGNRRLRTVIEDVSFSFHFEDEGEYEDIKDFYLTWMEAETFMSFLNLLKFYDPHSVSVRWSEETGKPMMERERTGEESLTFQFTRSNGIERNVQICSTWQNPQHKMAKIEGEGI